MAANCRPEALGGRFLERILCVLFNEELGAVIQIKTDHHHDVLEVLAEQGLRELSFVIGGLNDRMKSGFCVTISQYSPRSGLTCIAPGPKPLIGCRSCATTRSVLNRNMTACSMPVIPGLNAQLSFDMDADISAPFIGTGIRPPIAILREQGVNGHVEMAAAFDRAGFTAIDVHMSDIIAGRVSLGITRVSPPAAAFPMAMCSGQGRGWAKSILFNARARDEFEAFFRATIPLRWAYAMAAR